MEGEIGAEFLEKVALGVTGRLDDARVKERYSHVLSVRHYRTVGADLARIGAAPDLLAAGFLHGVSSEHIDHVVESFYRNLAKETGVSIASYATLARNTLTILQDRVRLRELVRTPGDADRIHSLLTQSVWPAIRDPRALTLLLVEQLDHLDPGGVVRRFLNASYRNALTRMSLPTRLRWATGTVDEAALRFVENVVAPTAQLVGNWREKNFAEDLVLFHRDRPLLEKIVGFTRSLSQEAGNCQRLIDTLRQQLRAFHARHESASRDTTSTSSFGWDWYHFMTIARRLGQQEESKWASRLAELGHVTIAAHTSDRRVAYDLWRRVHAIAPCFDTEIHDYMSRPKPSGYKALHTAIELPVAGTMKPVSIRILLESEDPRRQAKSILVTPHLVRAWTNDRPLRVYTRDGEPKYLRAGANVLDFAHSIRSDWSARVLRAEVNGEIVGVLRRLKEGDVVILQLSPRGSITWPPADWEASTTDYEDVREALRRAERNQLLEAARGVIASDLERRGYAVSQNGVDALIDRAMGLMLWDSDQRLKSLPRWDSTEWLREIGLMDANRCGNFRAGQSRIDEAKIQQLLSFIRRQVLPAPELVLPAGLLPLVAEVSLCEECEPDMLGLLVGSLHGSRLIVHRSSAACIDGRHAVPLSTRATPRVHIIVHGSNRIGLLADVVRIIWDYGLDIVDLVGRRLASSIGLIRVEADCPDATTLASVLEVLNNSVRGVTRAFVADNPDTLERNLPPRLSGFDIPFQENPYITNVPVTDPHRFYGRRNELAKLNSALDLVRPPLSRGAAAFVHGCLKSGKTSLGYKFLDDLNQSTSHVHFTVTIEAGRSEPVDAFFERLSEELQKQLLVLLPRIEGRRGPDTASPNSALSRDPCEALRALTRMFAPSPVVLLIDEAVRLFKSATHDKESRQTFERFLDFVPTCPGLLVVWVAPTAAARALPGRYSALLLTRFAQVELELFKIEDVASLLALEKLTGTVFQTVRPHIVDRVHRLCGGDAFWTATLAHEMWNAATRRERARKHYRKEDLEYAKTRMFRDGAAFTLRFVHMSEAVESSKTIAAAILDSLAQARGAARPGYESEGMIIRGFGGAVAPALILEVLNEMESVGLLSKVVVGDEFSYSLRAPILGDYLTLMPAGRWS